jgi:uncharacterized protein (TIGR02117 family)
MRRLFRMMAWAVGLFAAAVALGTLVPRPLLGVAADEGPKTRRILVLSNPIHTDIAVPVDDEVVETFGFLLRDGMPLDAPEVKYLVFGRGSREFYIATPTWDQLRPLPLLRGLTLDRAAMHIDIAGAIAEPHPDVAGFEVDERQFTAMLAYIRDSFFDDAEGPLIIPGVGYGRFDKFYEADGTFTALLGCNTWTARALREAGITTGLWNPLPATLRWSLDLYN